MKFDKSFFSEMFRVKKMIKPRKIKFSDKKATKKYQIKDNGIVSTFLYAFTITLPAGERLMIDTVRSLMDQVEDKNLISDLRGFIGQEAHHAKAQAEVNKKMDAVGYRMSEYDEMSSGLLKSIEDRPTMERLAIHSAYEHLTAVFSAFTLKNIHLLDEMEKDVRDMLVWHCIEEIEHKTVLFDLYEYLSGDYVNRSKGMFRALRSIVKNTAILQKQLLKDQQWKFSISEGVGAAKFFFGPNGIAIFSTMDLLRYFKKGFHPSAINDEYLIKDWEKRFSYLPVTEL